MKWIVYGAYRRDTAAIPFPIEAPNTRYAKVLFLRRHPEMRIVRIEKSGARENTQKDDWYGRTKKPRYRRND